MLLTWKPARRVAVLTASMLQLCPIGAPGATITVNSTADTVADDGLCTLREAIGSANGNSASGALASECAAGEDRPVIDTVAFAIPDDDPGCSGTPKVCKIMPVAELPAIANPVYINGYTQPNSSVNTLAAGDNAVLLIELDASNLSHALSLRGSHDAAADSSGSTIRGLAITHAAGDVITNIGSDASVVDTVSNVKILGNFINSDPAGLVATGAGSVHFSGSEGMLVGGSDPADRNVISGLLLDSANNSVVENNYFGLDASGMAWWVNGSIHLSGGSGNQIGIAGAGNLVMGDIVLAACPGNPACATNDNRVQGNFVGAGALGNKVLGNPTWWQGIVCYGIGTGNIIGGVGQGNFVTGRQIWAIMTCAGVPVVANSVIDNAVGVVENGAGKTTIGGLSPAEGNVIVGNYYCAVCQVDHARIAGNSIYQNGRSGISLAQGDSSPVLNDDGDSDTGPNNLQNYPVITTVTFDTPTAAHVSGSLNSVANTTFRVELFASPGCDYYGHGEGRKFLGAANVTTIGNNATFGPLALAVPLHSHVITATATDPDGNTSEFSECSDTDPLFVDGYDGG